MYKHLLIAADGSELTQKAVEQGLALAKSIGSKVTVVNVSEPWTAVAPGEMAISFPVDDYEKGVARNAEAILTKVAADAKSAGVACETLHVKDEFPADGIVSAAEARGCDLIVMASHGRRGLSRFFLGSQASRVVTQSKVAVLICK